jgi:hypothetical protein
MVRARRSAEQQGLSGNADQRGKPELIAQSLRRFFKREFNAKAQRREDARM